MDEHELSFLDVLVVSSKTAARYRRNFDEIDYSTTMNDLDSRISDVITSLAAIQDKHNVLNHSYDSLETYLDDLEEATLGKLSFFFSLLIKLYFR